MSTPTGAQGSPVTKAPSVPREQHKKNILKRLRTREHKTLSKIAEEISEAGSASVTVKHLVRAMSELVAEGKAIKHEARVPTYSAVSKSKK